MANLSPGEIVAVVCGLILAAAGAINTVGSAMEKIAKARKAAKAPNEEQDRRLHDLEEWRKEESANNLRSRVESLEGWRTEAKGMLANDKKELTAIHDGMRVSHMAQLALLDHALNGNNIEQMQAAQAALRSYLANK